MIAVQEFKRTYVSASFWRGVARLLGFRRSQPVIYRTPRSAR
jgi:hypothetical protein